MGNLHLVTGYAGEPHVASADLGSLFEALIRNGQFVMEAGANFAASVVTNNQIRISDGELLMQGRHVKLTPGAYVDITIENGTQGQQRNDLIVARYTRNPDSGIEECSLVVVKGTPAASNPSDPSHTIGNLNTGNALQHDFPLYRVPLSGLNIGELEALFTPQKSIFDSVLRLAGGTMTGDIAMSGRKVTDLGNPTANGDAVPLEYANNAYAPIGFSSAYISVNTAAELASGINDIYQSMADGTVKIIRAKVIANGLALPEGIWFITLYRTSKLYGYTEAVCYIEGGLRYVNVIYGGTWSDWSNRTASTASVTPATIE